MGRSSDADKRHLEMHSGKWRVVVSVPRDLHDRLGTKLKRSLQTDSLVVANRLKWLVVAELKDTITKTRDGDTKSALVREAVEAALLRRRAASEEERKALDLAVEMRGEDLVGPIIGEEIDPATGRPEPVHDPHRKRLAGLFTAVARGEATPLDHFHETYLNALSVKARTKADDERAIGFLKHWCEENHIRPLLEEITPKVAGRFMDGLANIAGGQSPVTLNKYLRRLSRYWQWLVKREYAEVNVWQGKVLEEPPAQWNEEERAFSDAEMLKLLNGSTSQQMHDLMRIGALTGARLDAIVCLSVGDCAEGRFVFKPQKKEREPHACPVHPDLIGIVQRRTEGREAADPLFPEWPGPKKEGSMRERSFKASNLFTEYRRAVGVEEMVPGKRRSLVNFHSFRRWFITKAERADQPEHIIAAVVGHKREGITLGRYSSGPLYEQAKRCVEAVKLPTKESVKTGEESLRAAARGG